MSLGRTSEGGGNLNGMIRGRLSARLLVCVTRFWWKILALEMVEPLKNVLRSLWQFLPDWFLEAMGENETMFIYIW